MVDWITSGKGHTETAPSNLAHDLGVKLSHACVATLAALDEEEMATICNTYNYLW